MNEMEKKLELLGKIPFFDGFTEMDIKFLAEMASFKKFEAGENVIEQGTLSRNLFFLINGQMDIVINGEVVTHFRGGGQVFGEMSFVQHNVASATVRANTIAVMMVFDIDKLNALNEPIHYRLRMDIFRSCAEVLAKKLLATNSIAAAYIHQERSAELVLD